MSRLSTVTSIKGVSDEDTQATNEDASETERKRETKREREEEREEERENARRWTFFLMRQPNTKVVSFPKKQNKIEKARAKQKENEISAEKDISDKSYNMVVFNIFLFKTVTYYP